MSNQPKGSGSLEFDGLLAEYHAIVWASAEEGDCDYDLAGVDTAKKLQAMFRAQGAQRQGEPVGVVQHHKNETSQGFRGVIFATAILDGIKDGDALYLHPAEQPAPVAVVLPERMTREQALELTDYPPESAMYWYNKALDDVRACLDKVKEMNR